MTICIDFDGVIHRYSNGYQDGSIYDPPVKGAARFIYDCMFIKNWSVCILSTREPEQIKTWLESVLFQNKKLPFEITILKTNLRFWNEKKNLGITNRKLAAHIYIDDRGLKFEGHFDNMMGMIEQFRTWHGK